MLSVKVLYRPPVDGATARQLADILPGIIAKALTCDKPDGATLTPEEVEVESKEMSFDLRTEYDLQIIVEANEYPARRKNLEQRCHRVLIEIRRFFVNSGKWKPRTLKGFVWIKLFPAHWDEI